MKMKRALQRWLECLGVGLLFLGIPILAAMGFVLGLFYIPYFSHVTIVIGGLMILSAIGALIKER